MKKLILGLTILLFAGAANAQNGLEQITVEKYYVSNATDASFSSGTLPAGSVTWRIYADMLPGYKFQAAYGVPTHTMKITTTTSFFNNTDYGSTAPTFSKTNAAKNSVMLDSWFSSGAACAGNFGILKTEDDGVANVVNNTPAAPGGKILQNNNASAGIPLTTQDGLIAGSPEAVTFVGLGTLTDQFNDGSVSGNSFITSNGSWASLNGSTGPVPATNRVLIAQITTDGILHLELNIQIGTPSGGVQNYVASSPVGAEITIPSLTQNLNVPNTLPTVSITSPANNATFVLPNTVAIAASAGDADGSVTNVEFLVDNVVVGSDNTSPYTFNWTAVVGTHQLKARATDDQGGQTTSTAVTVIVGNNVAPTISLTSPSNGASFVAPAVVNITANANDADGTVSQVEFFVDNVSVGIDNTSPYSFGWTSGSPFGNRQIKAVVTDNNNSSTTSSTISISLADPNALPYKIVNAANTCEPSIFCMQVDAFAPVANVIGYDIVMHYDVTKVAPTGIVTVSSNLINPAYVDVINSIDAVNHNVNVSLFFNGNAPANTFFTGTGNICCVEFSKTVNFAAIDTATFNIVSLQESYITGVQQVAADAGKYNTYKDSSFVGLLSFWSNNAAMPYNSGNASQYLVTNIYGNNATCSSQSVTATQPDLTGHFTYSTNNGVNLTIKKDIASATSIQPVVNGFDAFLARRVLINDATFTPSIFQLIAMDANLDGVVSAGDVSQINQRTVLINPEMKQAWNYNANGTSNGPLSKDWLFIDLTTLNNDLAYRVSNTYPADDGVGAYKNRVPVVPFCLPLPNLSADTSSDCVTLITETYKGILIGDVNGNYSTAGNGNLKIDNEAGKVVLDLTKAVTVDGYIDVPVYASAAGSVNALDFAVKYNESKLTFNSIISTDENIETLGNFNAGDNTLRFTSNSLQNYSLGKPVATVRFTTKGEITKSDFNSLEGYLNGDRVGMEINTDESASDYNVNIFPNPASEVLNVVSSEDATIQLFSVNGSLLFKSDNVNANEKVQINTAHLANGVYLLQVSNTNFVTTKKVVIQK
ncbi:MAG: Ig-like domain-containing protein [Bacteroidota bacterium]